MSHTLPNDTNLLENVLHKKEKKKKSVSEIIGLFHHVTFHPKVCYKSLEQELLGVP